MKQMQQQLTKPAMGELLGQPLSLGQLTERHAVAMGEDEPRKCDDIIWL